MPDQQISLAWLSAANFEALYAVEMIYHCAGLCSCPSPFALTAASKSEPSVVKRGLLHAHYCLASTATGASRDHGGDRLAGHDLW